MKNRLSAAFILIVAATLIFICSCATMPKIAELPCIPVYGNSPVTCKASVKIGIMVSNSYMDSLSVSYGQGKQRWKLTQSISKSDLCTWLAQEVAKIGVDIQISSYDRYITRSDRLMLEKIIRIVSVEPRHRFASDGVITDVRVTVDVHENGESETLERFDVWGRHIGQRGQRAASFDKAIRHAFANLITMPQFAEALDAGRLGGAS